MTEWSHDFECPHCKKGIRVETRTCGKCHDVEVSIEKAFKSLSDAEKGIYR